MFHIAHSRFKAIRGLLASFLLVATMCPVLDCQAGECAPIKGIDAAMSNSATKYLVVGDFHGTKEIPGFFFDVVCNTVASGRNVVVSLEWPKSAGADLNAFIAADTPAAESAAKDALAQSIGHAELDGRGSRAMFQLLADLKQLHAKHANLRIKLTQPVEKFEAREYEQQMAAEITRDVKADEVVLVFVGNAHAFKDPKSSPFGIPPMASYLPADTTVTMNAAAHVGESWSCRTITDDTCKIWSMGEGTAAGRGIWPDEKRDFDFLYSVGSVFSASLPQNARVD